MSQALRSAALVAIFPAATLGYLWRASSDREPSQAVGGPDASEPVPAVDLGEVRLGGVAILKAEVRNGGLRPLFVRRVETDCGCAAVKEDVAGRKIDPGESLTVEAAYHADVVTPFRRAVRVDLEDAGGEPAGSREYAFLGTVVEQVRVDPPAVRDPEAGRRYEVGLSLRWGESLTIESVTFEPPGPYGAGAEPESEVSARLTLSADCPAAYAGTLFVRVAADGRRRTVRLPVRVGMSAGPTLAVPAGRGPDNNPDDPASSSSKETDE